MRTPLEGRGDQPLSAVRLGDAVRDLGGGYSTVVGWLHRDDDALESFVEVSYGDRRRIRRGWAGGNCRGAAGVQYLGIGTFFAAGRWKGSVAGKVLRLEEGTLPNTRTASLFRSLPNLGEP